MKGEPSGEGSQASRGAIRERMGAGIAIICILTILIMKYNNLLSLKIRHLDMKLED